MFNLYNFQQKRFTIIIFSMLALLVLTQFVKYFYPVPTYERPDFSGEFKPVFYKSETTLADISTPKPPARNIFSSLQYTEQKNKSPKAALALPVLKGISRHNNIHMAIIEYGGESKTLSLFEFIGNYKLEEITNDAVTLTHNGQKIHLRLGGNNK